MTFGEYITTIIDVPMSDKLEYYPAVLWLNRGRLPLSLVSVGDETMPVIKIPARAANLYGNEKIIVPVIAISSNAFRGRQHITDVVLPSSIERLAPRCFAGCTNLRNITIPKRIARIPEEVFDGCKQLENIYYEGTPEEWEHLNINHQKHEVEFGEIISGTPVQKLTAERYIHIPGNESLFTANIHFHCQLSDIR